MRQIYVVAAGLFPGEGVAQGIRGAMEARVTVVEPDAIRALPAVPRAGPTGGAAGGYDTVLVFVPSGPVRTWPWDGAAADRESGPPVVVADTHDFVGPERALRLGARGYIGYREPIETTAPRVQAVMEGRRAFPDDFLATLQESVWSWVCEMPELEALSEKDIRVMRGIAAGKTAREIGRDIGLVEKAAQTYIRRLWHRLGLSSELELAALSASYGLYAYRPIGGG